MTACGTRSGDARRRYRRTATPNATALERPAILMRGGADPAVEVMPQRRRVAEARLRGHLLDRQVGVLEELPSQQNTLRGDPVVGRDTRLGTEPSRERPRRHMGALRQVLDGDLVIEVLDQPSK